MNPEAVADMLLSPGSGAAGGTGQKDYVDGSWEKHSEWSPPAMAAGRVEEWPGGAEPNARLGRREMPSSG